MVMEGLDSRTWVEDAVVCLLKEVQHAIFTTKSILRVGEVLQDVARDRGCHDKSVGRVDVRAITALSEAKVGR
jgi:hypothetical protein